MRHKVTVKVRAIRGGKPLGGVEVIVPNHPLPNQGTTGPNGTCDLMLEQGFWTFQTKGTKHPGPPARSFKPAIGNPTNIPLAKPVLLEPLDLWIDCIALTKRLKKRIMQGEYAKALALVQRVKNSNTDYKEVPQLQFFVQLEALLEKAMAGQDIASALEGVVIPRFRWKEMEEGR